MALSSHMITSALELPGYDIVENIGIVRGLIVRSRSIVGSFLGDIQTIFGGNITIYSELCEHARKDAYEEMLQHARLMGANAIIGFRYDATEIAPGLTEVLAYGTACKVRPTVVLQGFPQTALVAGPRGVDTVPPSASSLKLDLNHLSLEQLAALPGLNPKMAAIAVEFREKQGGFQSLEDFTDLLGLDPHQVDRLRSILGLDL